MQQQWHWTTVVAQWTELALLIPEDLGLHLESFNFYHQHTSFFLGTDTLPVILPPHIISY